MDIKTRNFFRHACFAATLLTAQATNADIFVGSGTTVLENDHFAIDSATSSLAYNSGTFSISLGDFNSGSFTVGGNSSGLSPTVNYAISGSFDLTVTEYWGTYYHDGDPQGLQGSFNIGTDWLTISNANIFANNLPSDYQMPTFLSSILIGADFSANNAPCSYVPPGASCWGVGTGSNITGQLQNSVISFNAFIPVGSALYGGGSTYQINASAVPLPASLWLFTSALGFFGIGRVKRKS